MRKNLSLIVIVLLFTTCKKSSQNDPLYDPVGTWRLASFVETGPNNYNLTATTDQYPCLSDNIFVVKADYTTSANYIGKDTCFLSRHGSSPNVGFTAFGFPGQSTIKSVWGRTGNAVIVGTSHGQMSMKDGKLIMTLVDTLSNSGPNKFIATTIEVKD